MGAVLPILHLNGYKIANPTILARISDEELHSLFVGYGYEPSSGGGRRPGRDARPRWPAPSIPSSTRSGRSSEGRAPANRPNGRAGR